MKKFLLFSLVLFYCLGVTGRQPGDSNVKPHKIKTTNVYITKAHHVINSTDVSDMHSGSLKKDAAINYHNSSIVPKAKTENRSLLVGEVLIGSTTYDLQTNGTISNRIVNNGDGTISAVWTMSQDPGGISGGWPDRGTGYNYFDGSNWGPQPTSRVEPNRTGFTNIAYAGHHEAIVCHDPTLIGEPFSSRATKGSGPWNTSYIPGTSITTLWPKMAAGGPTGNSFHVIVNSTAASGPLWYTRSTDDGVTWSTPGEIPQYIAGVDYLSVSADGYSIDARGSTVAIVSGSLGSNLVLLKSTDDGVTWTKTIVDSFPISLYDGSTMNTDTNGDGTADTLFTSTRDATVVLDNNNLAHVFFGGTRCLEEPGGVGLGFFTTDGIYYWNESMAPNTSNLVAVAPDLNSNGYIDLPAGCGNDSLESPMGYYGTGLFALIEMPSAGVDANNNIYLSYQAVDELSDTSIYYEAFMHPYVILSANGGINWCNPDSALDVVYETQGINGESLDGVYCSMAKLVDSDVHLIYQRDFAPGTTLSGATAATCESNYNNGSLNDIIYVNIAVTTSPGSPNCLLRGQNVSIQNIPSTSFTVSSNFPNPFTGKTFFDLQLKNASDVNVIVSNMYGQVLETKKYINLTTGKNTLTIDAANLASGIYSYQVTTSDGSATQKMIVQK